MSFLGTSRWGYRGIRFAAWVLAVVAFLPSLAFAAADTADLEYRVKASYLFNFVKFVGWPEASFTNSSAPFVIGLVGDDPFGRTVDETFAGRKTNGRSFVIRRFSPKDDPGNCHILFASLSDKSRLAKLLASLRGRPVLTVGETDRFGELGGMVNFTVVGGTVKLEANPEAAVAAGLKVSSKLLAVSKVVKTELPQ